MFRTNVASAAFTMYMQLEKAAKMRFVQKICTFNVDEIDTLLLLLLMLLLLFVHEIAVESSMHFHLI